MTGMIQGLNDRQREAVEYLDGPLFVFAGPGTGKTRVTTRKLAYLVKEKGFRAAEVLALTFSTKATREMEERARELLPGVPGIRIKTFHSFCNEVVAENALELGVNAGGPVFTVEHQQAWFLAHMEEFCFEHLPVPASPTDLAVLLKDVIGRLKQENIGVTRLESYVSKKEKALKDSAPAEKAPKGRRRTPEQRRHDEELEALQNLKDIARAYKAYEAFKGRRGLLDFGDMQMLALRLFEERPAVLERYRERIRYLIVDEFQDTDFIQLRIIFALAAEGNVTVVGDDDQSIYRFRGAYLTNMQEFDEHYRKAGKAPRTITLDLNYRCTENIQKAASELIKHNGERADKALRTGKGPGQPVSFTTYLTDEDQAVGFLREMEALHKGGAKWEDIAVLVRRRVDALPIVNLLEKAAIPFEVIGSRAYFEEPVMVAAVAYLRALDDPDGRSPALAQIMHRPVHGIRTGEIQKLGRFARNNKLTLWGALENLDNYPGDREHLARLRTEMDRLSAIKGQKGYVELVRALLFGKDFFQSEINSGGHDNIRLLNRFLRMAQEYRELYPEAGLSEFLVYVGLLSDLGLEDEAAEPGKGRVHLLTVHGSKGMEFPHVFIPCLSEDRFPSKYKAYKVEIPEELADGIPPKGAPEELHLQEERRLLYVGLTRAMERAYLGHCVRYGDRKTDSHPSQFIGEMGAGIERRVVSESLEAPEEVSRSAEEALRKHVLMSMARGEWQEAVDGLLGLGTLLHADVSGLKVDGKLDVDALVKRLNVRELEPAVTHARRAEYSPSKLETYESCPRLYWFSQVLEIPGEEKPFFELGKTVHGVLEEIARRIQSGKTVDEPAALKILDGLWKASAYDTKAAEKKAREEAEDMVKMFLVRQSARKGRIIELETGIELDLEGRHLRGRVDRIDETKDGLEVIDYKTSKERTKAEDLKQDFQLCLYKLGVEKLTGKKVRSVGLWYLRHDDPRMIELTAEEAEAVRQRALEVIKAIEAGKFEPTPGYQSCRYCDFKGLCNEGK